MSYHYHALAVKSDPAAVRASLHTFAQSFGGSIRILSLADFTSDPTIYLLHKHGDWTVLASASQGLMPALAVHLSGDIQAEVFCVDADERAGFEHFDLLRAGTLIYLFTSMGDVIDQQGVEAGDFVARIQPDTFPIPAGTDLAGDEFPIYAFQIFCTCVAPFDLEAYVQKRWWSEERSPLLAQEPPLACVRIDLPNVSRHQFGATGPDALSWHLLLGRA